MLTHWSYVFLAPTHPSMYENHWPSRQLRRLVYRPVPYRFFLLLVWMDSSSHSSIMLHMWNEMLSLRPLLQHDDVMKWKHFPRYWPFVCGIHQFPVNSPHKGQWRGALMFSLICVWINGWENNREAVDLRRHHVHYDVIVMSKLGQVLAMTMKWMCETWCCLGPELSWTHNLADW